LAADWITRLHSAHALTDRVWDEQLCVAEVDAVLERFQRTLGRTAGEDQLFAATRRRARDLGGSALPLVWQHGDFTAWNTLRDGASLRVLDWEGAKPGLPLCDLLRFVTHWHEIVRSPRSTDQRLAMFRQLFGGEASPSRATAHARQALDRYVNALGLAPGCGPVLLVTSWSALALQRHEQRRDAGASLTDSRAYNEWIDYLGVLTPSGLL
jgi:aminoglycoside phosphotransferase (APT) family kinase protein